MKSKMSEGILTIPWITMEDTDYCLHKAVLFRPSRWSPQMTVAQC